VDYETWCGDCVGVDYRSGSPWVVNPTSCLWDSDDYYTYLSDGSTLGPGESVSIHECRYSDSADHTYLYLPTDVRISSSSAALSVTEAFTWDAGSATYTVAPVSQSNGKYLYFGCVYA